MNSYIKPARYARKDMPQFNGAKALVLGGAFHGSIVAMFAEAGFERADAVEEADVVVFTGGVDVDPMLYGEQRHSMTQTPNTQRDAMEKEVYEECVKRGIPMFGICRGAQFLHVMNGGELWQDVNNHAGPDHDIYDIDNDTLVKATSIHHQMIMLTQPVQGKMEIIATTNEQIATVFRTAAMTVTVGEDPNLEGEIELEIEAGTYPETKCFFVQGHPEVGSAEYRAWSFERFEDFLIDLQLKEADDRIIDGETLAKNMAA